LNARSIFCPGGASGARTAPVISTVPCGSSAAICAIASGSRVSRNGNADSGQISTVASRTPDDCGPVARSDSSRYWLMIFRLAE
jgi:hypothetical protein